MNYQQLKQKHQEEFNNFPIGFAFSRQQFDEYIEKWNLELNENGKYNIIDIGGGGFIRREDLKAFADMCERHREEEKTYYSKPKFMEDAFYYEMCNHEYGINWQADYDVLSCFGHIKYCGDDVWQDEEIERYFKQLGFSDEIKEAYYKAMKKYEKDSLKYGWI